MSYNLTFQLGKKRGSGKYQSRIEVFINKEIREKLDAVCKEKYLTRSEYIRALLSKELGIPYED